MKYIKLLRIHHYIKNLLVFAALVFSGTLFKNCPYSLLEGGCAFLAFCFISSTIYIVNDIKDKEKDAVHPTKRERPIASGVISVKKASAIAVICFVVSLLFNFLAFNPTATALLLCYFIINIGYSFGLKDVAIVDVAILASGFVIRVLYGAFVVHVTVSNWLYLTVLAIAFYFALGKRRNELSKSGEKTRTVLKSYTYSFLDKNMYLFLTAAIVFYSLWSTDTTTVNRYHSDFLLFSVPLVMLIMLRYSMIIEGKSDGDPVEVVLHDKPLIVMLCVYLLATFLIIYVI